MREVWLTAAEQSRARLIARRRDFHQHPELAFQETRTAGIVAQALSDLGMEVQRGVGRTGVIGMLEGAYDGPTVLVRADMDALPVREENAIPYASGTPGVMHACGHDGHTAIALSVAEALAPLRERMHGRVKFVFQPAEEIGRGALAMVHDGALMDPRPDFTVGLHLWNSLPVGKLGVADGPVMAGASNFTIVITGRGGHAASPHQNIDPVVCAAQVITALQTIISRNADPFDTGVVSVAQVHAGDAHNVIPQTAELRGTMRYFRYEVRDLMITRMRQIVEGVASAMGCTGSVDVVPMTRPVSNDAIVGEKLRPLFAQIVGEQGLDTSLRSMGSEDVGEFMEGVPGMYFFVGAQDSTAEAYYPHHHPRFSIDEEALPLGMALLAQAVAAYVLPEG
jgi:amidohydrolase